MSLIAILKKFKPDQPRHPKGSALGGQWSSNTSLGGKGSGSTKDILATNPAMRAAMLDGLRMSKRAAEAEVLLATIARLNQESVEDMKTKASTVVHKNPDGTWTPERMDLHVKIREKYLGDTDKFLPPAGEQPQVLLLAGRPGAGKSGFGKGLKIYDKDKYFVLNSDDIKELLKPDYDPERPWLVHRESSDLMDSIGVVARARGLNIVYDMTMNKSPEEMVTMFKNHGYHPSMHLMEVSENTSALRAAFRYANDTEPGYTTGRLVPPKVITGMNDITTHFNDAKSYIPDYTHYNHEEFGNPVRVDAGGVYKEVVHKLLKMFSVGY